MEKIRLGRTNMMVSRLGFGSVPIQRLSEDEGQEMQRLREELGTQFCRRCNYCQPCTADIPISLILGSCGSGRHPSPIFFFGELTEAIGRVANCTDCGECEGRCPYNLSIREMLAERVAWYEIEKDLLTSWVEGFVSCKT